jgi:hypothetical protein
MTWRDNPTCAVKYQVYNRHISGPVYHPRAASFDVAAKMLLKVEGPSKDCKA